MNLVFQTFGGLIQIDRCNIVPKVILKMVLEDYFTFIRKVYMCISFGWFTVRGTNKKSYVLFIWNKNGSSTNIKTFFYTISKILINSWPVYRRTRERISEVVTRRTSLRRMSRSRWKVETNRIKYTKVKPGESERDIKGWTYIFQWEGELIRTSRLRREEKWILYVFT